MAGGRRNLVCPPSRHSSVENDTKKCHTSIMKDPQSTIRHIPLPDIPRISVVAFETAMFMFSIIALVAHYLNIYRTVFWLPHSHTHYAVNLYLIEPGVVGFILVSISRRLIWCIVKSVITNFFSNNFTKTAIPIARSIVVMLLAIVLGYCLTTISDNLTYIKVLALAYPIALYFFIFDFEMTSFLEVIPQCIQSKEEPSGKGKIVTMRLVQHSCLNNSEGIRNEAEFLSSHCYKRFTQVCYQTLVTVYYTTLIPCFFVPNSLHYDVLWVTVHTIFVAITCFLLYLVYCYPARFCDMVHRNIQHLGSWSCINPISTGNSSTSMWNGSTAYSRGAVIRHGRYIYKAEGLNNTAEPGNTCHARLFMVFNEVWRVMRYFFLLSLFCSVAYLVYLATLRQWHQVLATGIMLACNYVTLYVLLRDYLVLRTTYHQEQLMTQ